MSTSKKRHDLFVEGKAHQFLKYDHVHVNFIYSFTWDVTNESFEAIQSELSKIGWTTRYLHERELSCSSIKKNGSYQPNLVVKHIKVLEKFGYVDSNAIVIVPIELDEKMGNNKYEELTIDLQYTLRIFENGTGVCTFIACLKGEDAKFKNIHFVLRLAQNVDITSGLEHSPHLTNSYLRNPGSISSDNGKNSKTVEYSFFPKNDDIVSLNDIFEHILENPPEWFPKKWKSIWLDSNILAIDEKKGWQTPFVFTIAEVDDDSYVRFIKAPCLHATKEVASILCKLTVDNRYADVDYAYMNDDYIFEKIPYNRESKCLLNLCLDWRLFFSFCRRGAIAICPDLGNMPSYFVLPSLLNLIEIIRARWHLGNIVNIQLNKAIERASYFEEKNVLEIYEQSFKWRCLFALFLRDPVPFLFDGGSITEIAEIAEKELWLNKLRDDAYRKFDALDKLIQYMDYKNITSKYKFNDQGSNKDNVESKKKDEFKLILEKVTKKNE